MEHLVLQIWYSCPRLLKRTSRFGSVGSVHPETRSVCLDPFRKSVTATLIVTPVLSGPAWVSTSSRHYHPASSSGIRRFPSTWTNTCRRTRHTAWGSVSPPVARTTRKPGSAKVAATGLSNFARYTLGASLNGATKRAAFHPMSGMSQVRARLGRGSVSS